MIVINDYIMYNTYKIINECEEIIMSQTVSLRLPDELVNRLDRFAQKLGNGTTRSRAGIILLDEVLRAQEFEGIHFRNTIIGRQAFITGTGMEVWQFIMVGRALGMDADRVADHLGYPVNYFKAALKYYNAYKDEINMAIANNDIFDEEKIRQLFPDVLILPSEELEKAS